MNYEDLFGCGHDHHCEVTTPWIVDPSGDRWPALRIHQGGDDPEEDTVIPLTREALMDLMGGLTRQAMAMEGVEGWGQT
jgi:hypothetical protein